MSASSTFYALGSLTHGYGVNGEERMADAAFAAAVYLGMAGTPKTPWESLSESIRRPLIRELRSHPGVTSYDLVRLLKQRPVSKTFPKPPGFD